MVNFLALKGAGSKLVAGPRFQVLETGRAKALLALLRLGSQANTLREAELWHARRCVMYAVALWKRRVPDILRAHPGCSDCVRDGFGFRFRPLYEVTEETLTQDLKGFERWLAAVAEFGASKIAWS